MDLTVITVCRNAASTLPRCIDSVFPVLSTTGLSAEHIIIDGASVDGTVELLEKELHQKRITRYISEPDTGIYEAMNKGIGMATGTVCVFINADDEMCADAAEACCRPILNGTADYTVSTARVITTEGKLLRHWKPDFEQIWVGVPYCHQTLYCRTEILRTLGGFRTDLRIAADTALIYDLYRGGYRHAIISKETAIFRTGGSSDSKHTFSEQINLILEYSAHSLMRAESDTAYAVSALKILFYHLNRYFLHFGIHKRDILILRALKLHRSIAELLPAQTRAAIRKRYQRKATANKLLSFLPGKSRKKHLNRAYSYASLATFC